MFRIGLGININTPSSVLLAPSPVIPANAIAQRDGSYILDRDNNYIETRV